MSDMITRVSQAIRDSGEGCLSGLAYVDPIIAARAAIKAMREPSPAMILEATDCGRRKLGNGDFWRAVIDAALSQDTHSPPSEDR